MENLKITRFVKSALITRHEFDGCSLLNTSTEIMIYPAETYFLGQGLSQCNCRHRFS